MSFRPRGQGYFVTAGGLGVEGVMLYQNKGPACLCMQAPPKENFRQIYLAAATARRASTLTRWARYSGDAWISLLRPLGLTDMPAMASGENFASRAFSISGTRKTLGPAPVTATRTDPSLSSATMTPTIA